VLGCSATQPCLGMNLSPPTAFSDGELGCRSDCRRQRFPHNASMNAQDIKVDGNDKLHWLRRLDRVRRWDFLDDQRCCLCCHKTFTGRHVQLVGGTRPFGPIRLLCPTRRCPGTPSDWVYLHEVPARAARPSRTAMARIVRIKRKRTAADSSSPIPPVPLLPFSMLRTGFRFLRHVGVLT
jgi:hypothetical protein